MTFPFFRVAAVVCLQTAAFAGVLKPGDDSPKIRVSAWVQGEEVKQLEGDKVYIVEFWATWCGPCVASIPHLDEVHKKYRDKGLVVIGQNLGEDAKTVSSFIKGMGGKMTYRVTVDDKAEGGWMGKYWLTAAGQNGIPCAFVVSKAGKIAYVGHPMELKESLLEKLLAEPSTKPAPAETAPEAESVTPGEKASALAARAGTEIAAGKLDDAERTLALLHDELPANFGYVAGLLELDVMVAGNQSADAVALAGMLCEDYAKKPAVLVAVASRLVSGREPAPAARTAAENIAKPLAAVAGETQWRALATLARVAFLNGEKDRAVELQSKAVSLAPKSDEVSAKSVLESYRQGNLPAAA